MKTLTESIIGRKGVEKNPLFNNRTRLRQGDIVYFEKPNLGPYLVILDKNLYKRLCGKLTLQDKTELDGFLVQSRVRYGYYMVPLSEYDKDLRYKLNSKYNITTVLRGNGISSDDIGDVWDFIDWRHLGKLADKFKVVFKDGQWIK